MTDLGSGLQKIGVQEKPRPLVSSSAWPLIVGVVAAVLRFIIPAADKLWNTVAAGVLIVLGIFGAVVVSKAQRAADARARESERKLDALATSVVTADDYCYFEPDVDQLRRGSLPVQAWIVATKTLDTNRWTCPATAHGHADMAAYASLDRRKPRELFDQGRHATDVRFAPGAYCIEFSARGRGDFVEWLTIEREGEHLKAHIKVEDEVARRTLYEAYLP